MSEYERVLSLIEDALAGEYGGTIRVPVVDLKTLIEGRPEHDRQVAERAWDEGYGSDEECHTPRRNPYRKEAHP